MRVTPTEPEYDMSDSDTDPVQHERFLMYRDYGVILIDEVTDADYLYTMSSSSNIRITPSVLSQADKLRAIQLIRTLLFDTFPKEQLARFPLKCIIGSGVYTQYTNPEGVTRTQIPSHLDRYYFAFGISKKVLDDPAVNKEFSSNVLSEFVLKGVLEQNYGEDYLDLFVDLFVDKEEFDSGFYVVYGDMHPDPDDRGNEFRPADYPYEDFAKITDLQAFAYEQGLPSVSVEHGKSQYWEKPEVRVRLKEEYYLPGYLSWAFLTPEAEKTEILNKYPEFKRRFEIFKVLIKKYVDLDL